MDATQSFGDTRQDTGHEISYIYDTKYESFNACFVISKKKLFKHEHYRVLPPTKQKLKELCWKICIFASRQRDEKKLYQSHGCEINI